MLAPNEAVIQGIYAQAQADVFGDFNAEHTGIMR